MLGKAHDTLKVTNIQKWQLIRPTGEDVIRGYEIDFTQSYILLEIKKHFSLSSNSTWEQEIHSWFQLRVQ